MLLSHSHDTSYLLFAAHAPCNDSLSAVKDAFWSSLGSVVGGARNRQLLVHVMFCIDADAKIGQVGNSAIGPLSPSDETYMKALNRTAFIGILELGIHSREKTYFSLRAKTYFLSRHVP